MDEIVTRAGFHATFMETCTDVGNRRRDSHILWDTTTAANNLAFPISSAYLVGGVQDDLRVSAIPIKHMVPKPRRESSPFARLEDEVYIHAFGEGTEMFGLSRSKHFFNESGDVSVMVPKRLPSLAPSDGSVSSNQRPENSLWIPDEAEISDFEDRVFPIESPS